MKYLLSALIITIVTSGCSTRNAFSKLEVGLDEEYAIENTRSGKIKIDEQITGVFSSVYLNNFYKNIDKSTNQFYISVYSKTKEEGLKFTLNKKNPLLVQRLACNNEFVSLLPLQTKWTQNYLVSFEDTQLNTLTLKIDIGPSSSGPLSYLKDQ
ncbi:hypothetical protein JHD48_08815 [Sulfurimonas sp. SAG-AH-194-I05]|nr:hypothetical protein [Sulfurimonas sp. SAG-AH-194-I05]MDF1875834.1 hypothetical protein [Sulfurimonas sp. SAG-AH-194-I05]